MSTLQNNIASLEALITKANALPEEKTIQSSKTVTPSTSSQTVKPDSGYDGMGQVVVNAMPTATQATPSVSINSAGKITATATQSAGYVAAGTKTGTKQLTTQAAKTITPTKSSQTAVAKNVYTTGAVTVAAIPSNYNDTSAVTAAAADVLANKVIVNADGETISGTMPANGAVTKTLDATSNNQSYTVPKGYHNGSGKVSISLETKTATPTKSAQDITPTSGKVLSKVTVAPIPDKYQDVSPVTTTAPHVLDGDIFVDKTGVQVEGSMPNNGAIALTIDPLTQSSVEIPAGYTSGGNVTMTEDLLNALKTI